MTHTSPLSPPFNILIVDDHRFIAELLGQRLGTDSSMRISGIATRAQSAFEFIDRHRVDIALLDMELGEDDGVQVARNLLDRDPALRIIGLSAFAESHYPLTLLEIGGRGFMSKRVSATDLVAGVRRVARGDLAISADVAMYLATAHSGPGQHARLRALTAKEIEVLQCLSRGYSVDEISGQLGISIKTVHSHRSSMKRKLKAHTDVELCLMALRAGVVSIKDARAPG